MTRPPARLATISSSRCNDCAAARGGSSKAAKKTESRERHSTIDSHYHSGLEWGQRDRGLAYGRDRGEIPPLRRPTRSRTNERRKRRAAPVGMTVGSNLGSRYC